MSYNRDVIICASYNAPHHGKSYSAEMPDNTIILSEGVRMGVEYANTLQAPAEDIERFAHADNGPLKGEKGQIREGGIRIPTTLCWKGSIKPGQVIDQPSANIDILPTLLDILMPDHSGGNEFDGISLLPGLCMHLNV